MTPQQVTLIHDSFAEVESEHSADVFYRRLFEVAPQLRPYFRDDMSEQRIKFMATLSMLVNSLGNLEIVLPAASRLARQHVEYGVKPEHYAIVGETLQWTFQRMLGLKWTRDIAEAWAAAYGMLSDHMIGEAYGRQNPAE